MNDDRHPVLAWARDLALAYAAGLVLGAPVALVAVRVTGVERAATLSLLLAMCAVCVALRLGRAATGTSPGRQAHGPEPASGAACGYARRPNDTTSNDGRAWRA
jgi:hypothetical protein